MTVEALWPGFGAQLGRGWLKSSRKSKCSKIAQLAEVLGPSDSGGRLLLPRVGGASRPKARWGSYVCPSVCLFSKRVSGSSYSVENASDAALVPSSPEMKPALAAVGSATVAVLSQSSGKFLLRVVRDVDKAENGCAVAFVIVQSYAEELGVGILEQG